MKQKTLPFQKRRAELRRKVGNGWLLLYKGGEYFNENLYYLTGIDSFFSFAMISLESEHEIIFTNNIEFSETMGATDIINIQTYDPVKLIDKLNSLIQLHEVRDLYCDYGLNSRTPLPAEVIDSVRSKNSGLIIRDLPQDLSNMRIIKEPEEIGLIKDGIAIIKQILSSLPEVIKPGLPEAELASIIYKELVSQGFNRFYDIFVASGPNSAIPYYRSKSKILPPDHVVLVDICAARGNYVCDVTRTFPTSEKFPSGFQKLYSIVTQVQNKVMESVREGMTLHKLSEFAKKLFKIHEVDEFYLNKLGHFVGLSPDDPGNQHTPFQKGMTLTIEPGLYLPEAGLRIEDTIIVEK